MRTYLKSLPVLTLAGAVALSACSDARATDADADLKRDLELASSTVSLAAPQVDSSLLSGLETQPRGTPETAKVVRKAPGPRAVRSAAPTVLATPEADLAEGESEGEAVEIAEAPAPESAEPVAVAPRPQPVVIETGGTGDYGTGNGGVWGTGGGVVIRGGGVHGDNCELHRRGRGPVYVPTWPSVPTTGGSVVNLPRPDRSGMGGGGIGGISSRDPRVESRGRVAESTPRTRTTTRTSPRGR